MRISDWSSDVCSSDLALGVSSGNMENLLYIPLAFACWKSPVIGIVYAHTGLFPPRATDAERRGWEESGESVADLSARRSEERRGGKERGRTCRYGWSPNN